MASRGIQSLLKAFVDAASRSAASVPPIAIRSLPGTPASACATDSIFLRLKGAGRVMAAAPDSMRTAHGIHSSAGIHSDETNGANQEMAEIFGISQQRAPAAGVAARDAGGGAAPQGRSEPKEGGGFAYQPDEPRPTKQSASLRHPKAGQTGVLSHIDKEGRAAMVDVSRFLSTQREAVASAKVTLGPEVFGLVSANAIKKGDVMTVAQLAGIMGAKQCAAVVPLCHNVFLSYVDVKLKLAEGDHSVHVTAEVHTNGPTGVEMEALTAASTAALTIFDMCKAVSRRMEITDLRLERKIGGKSGTFDRSKGG